MRTDWAQRWRKGLQLWRAADEGGFDADRYEVVQLEQAEALAFVRTHHYQQSWPSVTYRFGMLDHAVQDGPRLVGVITLGTPMSRHVLTRPFPTLEPYRESLEWSRLVLLDEVPANGESWFSAQVFGQAAALGVRGLVTFADPAERWRRTEQGEWHLVKGGHIGRIYQALSMEHVGRSKARWRWILPDGGELTDRAISKVVRRERGGAGVVRRLVAFGADEPADDKNPQAWLLHALEQIGARRQKHPGNLEYIARLGTPREKNRTVIGLAKLPYPREQLVLDVARGRPAGPVRTLQALAPIGDDGRAGQHAAAA